VKIFILFLLSLSFSFSSLASEEYSNKISIEIEDALISKLSQVKEKEIYTPANKFRPITSFACGVVIPVYTLDEQLEFQLKNGQLRIISNFKSTGKIISYTPIRDLSGLSVRPALFKGHYFISE